VVLHGDGGGKAPALARALHGRARVARTLMAWLRAGTRVGGFTSRREELNGHPGCAVLDRDGRLISVMILDIADGRIQGVSSIVNPTSCGTWGRWPTSARCCAIAPSRLTLHRVEGPRCPA
jgi:RNA polymerase sigma-70 factor (ECF subfamily)